MNRLLFRELERGETFTIQGRKALLVKVDSAFARPAKGGTIVPVFPGCAVVRAS